MRLLEQRIAELERRLDDLGVPEGEALQPTFITIDPVTGAIGALFTGGLLLNETASGGYVPQNALGWQDAAGTVREFIESFLASGNHILVVESGSDANDYASIQLASQVAGAAGGSVITLNAQDQTTGVAQQIFAFDSRGRSGFFQIGANDLSISGTGSLTWPGGTQTAQSATITPTGFTNLTGVTASCDRALPGGNGVVTGVVYVGTNGFQVFAFAPAGAPALNNTSKFAWTAWGN